jgi:hypothetical protein
LKLTESNWTDRRTGMTGARTSPVTTIPLSPSRTSSVTTIPLSPFGLGWRIKRWFSMSHFWCKNCPKSSLKLALNKIG